MSDNLTEKDQTVIAAIKSYLESKNAEIYELRVRIGEHEAFEEKLEEFVKDMTHSMEE